MSDVRRTKTTSNPDARAIAAAIHLAAEVTEKKHARPFTLAHRLLGPEAVKFRKGLHVDAYVAPRCARRADAFHILLAVWLPPRARHAERLVARELGRWAIRQYGMTFDVDGERTLPTGRVVSVRSGEEELASQIGDALVARWTRKAA